MGRPGLYLHQNFPNPCNLSTEISFYLEKDGHTSLKIFALDGSLVKTVLDGWQINGEHQITFCAESLENGIYFYQLEADGLSEIRKMVVLK